MCLGRKMCGSSEIDDVESGWTPRVTGCHLYMASRRLNRQSDDRGQSDRLG